MEPNAKVVLQYEDAEQTITHVKLYDGQPTYPIIVDSVAEWLRALGFQVTWPTACEDIDNSMKE